MGKVPKPPSGGGDNSDKWAWIVCWIISVVAAMGAGVGLGESGKEREKRERDDKWRELLRKEKEKCRDIER